MSSMQADALREPAPLGPSRSNSGQTTHRLIWIFLATVAISAFALKKFPLPFAWASLAWSGALFASIPFLRGSRRRAAAFNLGFVALLVAGLEVYLNFHSSPAPEYSSGYKVSDDILGYAPAKGSVTHARRSDGHSLIYDVTYTIDANGLRISPPWHKDVAGTVLFFGCSFTYGEGLHDNETLAYQVGTQSGGRYRTLNFGFHGYGPHQMLAAIEHGMVRRIVDTRPQYVFYTAIPNHVVRVVGKVNYGKHAPRYLLDTSGNVYQAGRFEDVSGQRPDQSELTWQLSKSAIYRTIQNMGQLPSDDDIRLMCAVVRKSKDRLTAEYPGIQFHVILWPGVVKEEEPIYQKLKTEFQEMGFPLHIVEDILPGYAANPSQYLLGGNDRHPNALANRLLAQYLLDHVIARPAAAAN